MHVRVCVCVLHMCKTVIHSMDPTPQFGFVVVCMIHNTIASNHLSLQVAPSIHEKLAFLNVYMLLLLLFLLRLVF